MGGTTNRKPRPISETQAARIAIDYINKSPAPHHDHPIQQSRKKKTMRFLGFLLLLPALALTAVAAPAQASDACQKAIFILSGDSTTAPQSAGGGGWGNGFRDRTLLAPSFAENHAANGRSTKTVLENGEWTGVLAAVKKYRSQGDVYVTVQFGHNDQKLANFMPQFEANLKRMVADVTAAGGVPVRGSSLSAVCGD